MSKPDEKRPGGGGAAAPATVAVLGGCGFMGSRVCRALLAAGHPVRVFDRLYASGERLVDIADQLTFFAGDMARPGDVLEAVGDARVIVHLAHTTVPGSSMLDPVYDVASNVGSAAGWLPRLPASVQQIVYVSSGGTVYGAPRTARIREDHPTDPVCSYGVSKLAVEKYVSLYAKLRGTSYRILRPANVYGVGQQLTIGQGVVGVLADRALRGLPLELWGTGESLRDYLYVDDMVAAVLAVLAYDGPERVFNVASGQGHSVLEIVAVLRAQLGTLPRVEHLQARGFDAPSNVLDPGLLERETGWRPQVPLEVGVARTIAWLRGRLSGEPAAAQ